MNLHKMIEICVKDDNMHIFVMINALICINNYVITCMNSMFSAHLHQKSHERHEIMSLSKPLSPRFYIVFDVGYSRRGI